LYIALLKGGRGFVESAPELNRQSFADYVESLDIRRNYMGIKGIGYNKIILPAEIDQLKKNMESDGFSDFKITPETAESVNHSVIFLEPLDEQNKRKIGVNMLADEISRVALETAGNSGLPTASAKTNFFEDFESGKQTGFFIFLPIYKNKIKPADLAERQSNLTGFIFSPFVAKDFLNEIQGNAANTDVAIRIFDGEIKRSRVFDGKRQ
jgi:CHASE1-domain containing sensor protein